MQSEKSGVKIYPTLVIEGLKYSKIRIMFTRWKGNAPNRSCAQFLRAELNARKSNAEMVPWKYLLVDLFELSVLSFDRPPVPSLHFILLSRFSNLRKYSTVVTVLSWNFD